jgi:hypothetical protein
MLPDYDRASVIGEYWANPKTRGFAEVLIGAEESHEVRAMLVGDAPREIALKRSLPSRVPGL